MVDRTADGECPGTFGDRCFEVTVTCPGINDAAARIRATGTGSKGTVVFTTGGRGVAWYWAGGELTPAKARINGMMDSLLGEGFRLVEVAWKQPGVWEAPGGTISLACRSATVLDWIYISIHQGGLFAAQGNSGGSSQIAFSLAYYGLDRVLDLANLSGGPPPCPISIEGEINFREQKECVVGEPLWNESREPMLLGNPLLNYPNTTVRFFIGENEKSDYITQSANNYHSAIESEKSIQVLPNTAHQVHHTVEGVRALYASIREALTTSPKVSATPSFVTNLIPLMDMPAGENYKGEDGGLYGGGLNDPPPSHRLAALKALAEIEPLDAAGNPIPDGKVVFISIGMSNATMEFQAFEQLADSDPSRSSHLVIVDGAQGGVFARTWARSAIPWEVVKQRLEDSRVTPQQVQVAWVKAANGSPTEPFPTEAKSFQGDLATIATRLKEFYPNIKLVYLSSRIYAGYATTDLSPEPHAYESAFSIRWLIQDQINGNQILNYDPDKGPVTAPILLWGPYLWADGLSARSDGLIWRRGDLSERDGTHPAGPGREKVANLLLDFLKTNELAKPWFVENR